MEPFVRLEAAAAPLPVDNVDTDSVFPAAFVQRMDIDYARALFANWRFEDRGFGREKTDFVLNQPRYREARILVAGWNFGCGSSREHAVWALTGYGFRCVIAKSYGGIFFDNCLNNGVLALVLPETEVDELTSILTHSGNPTITVDLEAQTLIAPGERAFSFDIEPVRKHRLLQGLDEVALSLGRSDEVEGYRKARNESHPWMFPGSWTMK